MTEALRQVLTELERLPDREQDRIATLLREELDRQWDELLESPQSIRLLDTMAERALKDLREGRTKDLKL